MCTAITLQSLDGANFLARTMDFSYDIQPHLYIVPRNYTWFSIPGGDYIRNNYSFIGSGQELNGLLGFFDGVNEFGFAAGALYFAGYAQYQSCLSDLSAIPVGSYDFLHYLLGNCTSLDDLMVQLKSVEIVGLADPVTQSVAPLHWIATDKTGRCVVLEQTAGKGEVFRNPIGVLSNSPDFPWHMTNLNNYAGASPLQTEAASWENVRLAPFSQGGGTVSLPGGYTSPERFVRAAYLKTHLPKPKNSIMAVTSSFQILKGVSIPQGAVITMRNTADYTRYTACINTNTCEYFFNTYNNPQIKKARLRRQGGLVGQVIDLGKLMRPIAFEEI